jgi:hypothetical protein
MEYLSHGRGWGFYGDTSYRLLLGEATRTGNYCQNTFKIVLYFTISKTNHPITVLLQPGGSGLIIALLFRGGVTVTVNFHHQFLFVTTKIRDKPIQGMLSSEFQPV